MYEQSDFRCILGFTRHARLLFKSRKTETTRLKEGVETAVDTESVQLLADSAVQLEHLEARGDHPHVVEGDGGELAAPLGGDADSAQQRADGVAQTLPAVETLVRVDPHAVHGVGAIRLAQHVFERNLQQEKVNL